MAALWAGLNPEKKPFRKSKPSVTTSDKDVYQDHYENIFDRPEAVDFFASSLASHLPDDRTIRILDIGCATGLALQALKTLGYHNTEGVDINAAQVKTTRDKGFTAHHVEKTSAWLDEYSTDFHLIIATDVLEHMSSEEQVDTLTAIRKRLTPGGKFVCTVPNANSVIASRWRYIDLTHRTSFTESSLRSLLLSAGFSRFQISGSDPFLIFDQPNATAKRVMSRALRKLVRMTRRVELVAELGPDEGLQIPININLLAAATK